MRAAVRATATTAPVVHAVRTLLITPDCITAFMYLRTATSSGSSSAISTCNPEQWARTTTRQQAAWEAPPPLLRGHMHRPRIIVSLTRGLPSNATPGAARKTAFKLPRRVRGQSRRPIGPATRLNHEAVATSQGGSGAAPGLPAGSSSLERLAHKGAAAGERRHCVSKMFQCECAIAR